MNAEQMVRLEQLLNRQDILDCIVRFSRGIDRFDRQLFLSAFHDDAIISAGDFVGGPGELYEWASHLHEQAQTATQHDLLNHSCDIDGDTAHAETYYLFVGRNRDESNWMAGGRYIDRLECRNGTWKITFRTNAVEWSGMLPTMDIPFADVVDMHLNGVASRSSSDLSYLRPLLNKREKNIPTS
ncbi:MAG: nuclear transport factor 2 family protein [Pseudomonadales bacterium]